MGIRPLPVRFAALAMAVVACLAGPRAMGQDQTPKEASRPKRLLLIGQRPDGHPFSTHEYMAGVGLMARMLQSPALKLPGGVQPVVVQADGAWKEGPELLDAADGAFLFASEGAKWIADDERRAAAFDRLALRGGGLVCLHWGMGTREAAPIERFVALFGGCHGGPDRKYQVITARVALASPKHAVLSGLAPLEVEEEFYYALKFPGPKGTAVKSDDAVTPLLRVSIDGGEQTVAWAWERPDGGRSFGFTGGHFHRNWERPEYRRLMLQGTLWTLKLPIPAEGIHVEVKAEDLKLPPR